MCLQIPLSSCQIILCELPCDPIEWRRFHRGVCAWHLNFNVMKKIISARAISLAFTLFAFGLGLARAQTTSNSCDNPVNSGAYSKFSIFEVGVFTQSSSSGAVPLTTNSFEFEAVADLATNLTASAATVTVPGKSAAPMFAPLAGDFLFFGATNSAANLASAFPSGNYKFTINSTNTTVSLPAGNTLPNAPTLNNYDDAQAIDATADFTLSWGAFTGGVSKDYIGVVVYTEGDTVFQSDSFGCPGVLEGTATSIVIPANTLVSNQTYKAEILFIKVLTLNTNSTHDVALFAATEAATETTISTGATVAPALYLTNAAWLPGGSVRFDVTTTPGQIYEFQFSTDISNPSGWSTIAVMDAVSTLLSFTNTPTIGVNAGFYRAVQVE
jgi:hypothetical protein